MLIGKPIEAIYHSSIVVYGVEYFFGGGICQMPPKKTPYGIPIKEIDYGTTEIPKEIFEDYLKEITDKFSFKTYNMINNNCNHFTNDICIFLTGNEIPDDVLNQHKSLAGTPMGNMILPFLEKMNIPQMMEGNNNNFNNNNNMYNPYNPYNQYR